MQASVRTFDKRKPSTSGNAVKLEKNFPLSAWQSQKTQRLLQFPAIFHFKRTTTVFHVAPSLSSSLLVGSKVLFSLPQLALYLCPMQGLIKQAANPWTNYGDYAVHLD